MHIVHIINPYPSPVGSFDQQMQDWTVQSMLAAKRFSSSDIKISLCYTRLKEDDVMMPDGFQELSALSRTVQDVNTNLKGKKLPLIQDILEKVKELNEVDFVIYTNMDIVVLPSFYDFIFDKIKLHDAVIINRRRIHKGHIEGPIADIYADLGLSHPGFDCFVLHRTLLDLFDMGQICIGIPFLESSFTHHIAALAKSPFYVLDQHLTTHIGLEVMPKIEKDYYWHNRNEFFRKIQPRLKSNYQLRKFPYSELPFFKRICKWGLNPSLFIFNYLSLEYRSKKTHFRSFLAEWRWRFLQR